ncbi:MAG: VWA domain-containing protein [Coxiellaceae bacterium]|nr:VWA domain-containing protein [Coxiellaceae bacterium]
MAMMHFIRPDLFWLIIGVALFLLSYAIPSKQDNQWRKVIDQHLLSHLAIKNQTSRGVWSFLSLTMALILAVFAAVGPSWQKNEVPGFEKIAPLVILLDLSPDMLAKDIKPNRLLRAKFKIIDLLKQRKGGQTALIAFTSEPFVVTPLTEDSKTVTNLLDVLQPDIMPVQGQDVSRALLQAQKMLHDTGETKGHVLLITNRVLSSKAIDAARKLHHEGTTVSVLGVGTTMGAPEVTADGALQKTPQGNVVMTRLTPQTLMKVAAAGGGRYEQVTTTSNDIDQLSNVVSKTVNTKESKQKIEMWRDEGHWFILGMLPLILFAFRRGYL